MFISAIRVNPNNFYHIKTKAQNTCTTPYFLNKIQKSDSVCFCANKQDKYSYKEFIKAAGQSGINSVSDLENNIKQENIIGIGANSEVFKFDNPKLEKWVLKRDKNPFYEPVKNLFEPVTDDFFGFNVGQEIAKSGNRYRILKKVTGTPHSIANWSHTIDNGSHVNREESLEFLNSLKEIQKFPQSAFNDYAQSLKKLGDKGYKQDSINPNNILIDHDKKMIQIIDFFKVADPSHVNSKYDLTSALLDFSLYKNFYEKLRGDEQKQLLEYSNTIIEKCNKASKIAGLRQDEKTYIDFLRNVDKWFGVHLVNKGGDYQTRYNMMKSILTNSNKQCMD